MTCLKLAVESLASYYQNETFAFVDDHNWGPLAREAMQDGQMDKFVTAHEEHMAIARENAEIMKRIEPEINKLTSKTFTLGA